MLMNKTCNSKKVSFEKRTLKKKKKVLCMNSSLWEILPVPFLSQVKMKERTKGPHDTARISPAASGTDLDTPSLTPWKSHRLHQGASASGDSKQGKDDASLYCDLLFASRSWLCACSCLTKQITGSDLLPAASVRDENSRD